MKSFNCERIEIERVLTDFLYRREQTTELIQRSGRSGPLAYDSVCRLKEKAAELEYAIRAAVESAEKGIL